MNGSEKEHYLLLMQVHGRIAGAHKAGLMGSPELLRQQLHWPQLAVPQPFEVTGQPPKVQATQLRVGLKFITQTAKVLFPSYVQQLGFQEKLFESLMTLNAYSREVHRWKHLDPQYVALGHMNLNMDNAFFWRTASYELDCGASKLRAF